MLNRELFKLAPTNEQFPLQQTVSNLPKGCFREISSRRNSHYMYVAVWLRFLELELRLMFIGAAGRITSEPQRAVVMKANPLKNST